MGLTSRARRLLLSLACMFAGTSVAAVDVPFNVSMYEDNSFSVVRSTGSGKAYVAADADNVFVAMAAEGNYVAFGMSKDTHGSMIGADIVVCGGDPIIPREYKGTVNGKPTLDFKQDWVMLRSGRQHGVTYCEVSRPRVSKCDLPIYDTASTHTMLLSWGIDGQSMDLHYHGQHRGSQLLPFNALPPQQPASGGEEQPGPGRRLEGKGEPVATGTTQTITLVAPPMNVPSLPGIETCSYHSLPIDPNKGYHIIGVNYQPGQMVGGAADRGMSHHSTLIGFANGIPAEHLPGGSGKPWVDGELLPLEQWQIDQNKDPLDNCGHMWGLASGDLVPQVLYIAPDQGVYFGKNRAIGVVLLRHFYNDPANPQHLTGAEDINTTWKLSYTENLRPKTLGKFHFQTTTISIPPKSVNYKVSVMCTGDILGQFGSIKLTGVAVHAHDRSSNTVRVDVRHFRGNQELTPFSLDDDYVEASSDEAEQPLDVELKAGDDMLLECYYDNPTSDTIVWGAGTNNQMCVANFQFTSVGPAGPLSCMEQKDGTGYRISANGYNAALGNIGKTLTAEERAARMALLLAGPPSVLDKCDGTDDWWSPTKAPTHVSEAAPAKAKDNESEFSSSTLVIAVGAAVGGLLIGAVLTSFAVRSLRAGKANRAETDAVKKLDRKPADGNTSAPPKPSMEPSAEKRNMPMV